VRRGDSTATPITGGTRRVHARRGPRLALAVAVALASVSALSATAVAAPSAKHATGAQSKKKILATLKIQSAQVTVKRKGKSSFVAAKDGQALRQGDSVKTDTAGKAEIDYTDGSLTRLGNSTQFKITKLTNKQGGRQTQGRLSVGETWNRAAKVSETGSFEVKAGGTTAAVEGTAFAVVCVKNVSLTCTFTDVVDNVKVTAADGTEAQLGPSKSVVVVEGDLGTINTLTYDQLANDVFIAGNLALDLQAGKGKGLADITQTTSNAAGTGGTGGTGGGGAGAPTVAGGDTTTEITVTPGPIVGAEQYPPNGTIVVDNPNVNVAGEATFRGSGCVANETLQVLFDRKRIGTIQSDAQGNFAGSLTIPPGTAPGVHTLTVRGAVCVLNATITVLGSRLAFTGSSNHTGTYVLAGLAAVVIGFVLVVGTRRRRRGVRGRSAPPPFAA
jgi:hypothetical protein